MIGPDFNIGELVITLSVDEVMKRWNINQGFTKSVGVVCKVIEKEFIQGNWMICVEVVHKDVESTLLSPTTWLNQYIFESYLPQLREDKLSKIL